MDDDAAFDRLCRRVYTGLRAGALDCTDTFDLAASVLASRPADEAATELARLSVEGTQAGRSRRADLAATLLEVVGFHPGFAEEPALLGRIEDALRLVNRDMAASGLRHGCRIHVRADQPGLNGNAYVESWDGHRGSGQGVFPDSGADPVSALVAVAEDAQDAVMHAIWSAWPECPVHRLGVHARDHDGTGVWWCAGAGGHAVAAIGEWPGR